MKASGIRLGTPALTTRGMKESEMTQIAQMIASIVREPESEEMKTKVKREVEELTQKFPMYEKRLQESKTEKVTAS
jgi:glycine hydroxymethyltransferase